MQWTVKAKRVTMILIQIHSEGQTSSYVIVPRQLGDINTCYSDSGKAWTELGWKAEYGIEEMCRDIWNWHRKNPDGYR